MKEHILPALHPDHAAGVTTLERQLSGKLEVAAERPEMAENRRPKRRSTLQPESQNHCAVCES